MWHKMLGKNALNSLEVADKIKVIVLNLVLQTPSNICIIRPLPFHLKLDTVLRKKFQSPRTDMLRELTVLSDLMPRHMLTLILWESKPNVGCKFDFWGFHHFLGFWGHLLIIIVLIPF